MPQDVITLVDSQRGSEAKIHPDLGFNCFSFRPLIQEQPMEVLWAHDEFAAGAQKPSHSGIPILFPFPGRIAGTSYEFQGREYPLEGSDAFGNAIHGFVMQRPWRVVEQGEKHVVGEFQASVDDPSILERWPADFLIRVKYTLAGNRLICDLHVENPDDKPLPFGLGTHAYFRVPLNAQGVADDCILTLPTHASWELKDMLPTGKKTPVPQKDSLRVGMPFKDAKFDDVFTDLQFEDGQCTASIVDTSNTVTLVVNFDSNCPHCVVYNPPHREAICFEPYTCVPNPFSLEEAGISTGLRILAPGESFDTRMEIRVDQRLGLGALPE